MSGPRGVQGPYEAIPGPQPTPDSRWLAWAKVVIPLVIALSGGSWWHSSEMQAANGKNQHDLGQVIVTLAKACQTKEVR